MGSPHNAFFSGRPRIIDLFCKAGGAARGYDAAGFDVVGVDHKSQPRYPFEFIQADVFGLDPDWIARNFDAAHASPGCQGYSDLRHAPNAKEHPRQIPQTRSLLKATGLPYVIENVRQAAWDMLNPATLCGSMFDLSASGFQLQRHRLFETSFPLSVPSCDHKQPVIGIYGAHVRCRASAYWRDGGGDFPGFDKKALACEAMGLPTELTMDELSEAIPPAYTRFIGKQLISHLQLREAA